MGKAVDKSTRILIIAPLSGKIIALEDVPDPVFSERVLGDGAAILPEDGKIYSPVNGEVASVAATKHAFGFQSEDGLDVLVHVGLVTPVLICDGLDKKQMKAAAGSVQGGRDYGNWKTRKALGIRVRGLGGWFYTVHMGWWKDEEEPFDRQWERLNEALEEKKREEAVWLLGDFNSPAEIRGEGYDRIRDSGWQDTYSLAAQKDDGITVLGEIDGWRGRSGDAQARRGMRMDHIWCSRPVPVLRSRVRFDGIGEPKVSDHFGVLVETGNGVPEFRNAVTGNEEE